MQAEVLGSVASTTTEAGAEVFRVGPFDDPDRYEIGEPVEAGAEGILYRGRLLTPTSRLSLPVAVKALQPVYSARIDQWAARWRDQVELLRSLHIPALVGVREGFVGPLPHLPGAETAGRNLYLVMNWVDGEALDHWVLGHRDVDVGQALKLLLPVAVAVDTMHGGQLTGGVPVVHRDIKPANILIGKGGSVLVDFGLTKGLSSGHPVGRAGTPGYIAPEVVAGGTYTPAADRYAFAATVFFLLTGRHPAAGMKTAQLRHVLESSPAGGAGTASDLVDRVVAMLDPDPEKRPVALANWIAQLRQSSLDDEILSVPLPPLAPTRAPRGRLSTAGTAGTAGSVSYLTGDTGGGGLHPRPGAHWARRGPVHARPRSRLTGYYAVVVLLAAALIGVAGDGAVLAAPSRHSTDLRLVLGPPGGTGSSSVAISPTPGAPAAVVGPNVLPSTGTTVTAESTTTVAAAGAKSCVRSFDAAACGPFHWDPQPTNRPLTATFTYSPAHPQPGDLVTFNVTLDDPDDSHLALDSAFFGMDAGVPGAIGSAGLATMTPGNCKSPAGAWPPPAPGPHGHITIQESFRYTAPGNYPVHFTASSGGTTDPCALPDPYASTATSSTQTVVVASPPPPPTTTTTTSTTLPPPTDTTTTVAPAGGQPPAGPAAA
ncbi:MAG TPA: serine/threonine-protein kinase [Acidimicrobiales bacterium]|jgi:hypothetical protein|nr:serine/threonine-protein kinase [Acidimicrobiales bacterium]